MTARELITLTLTLDFYTRVGRRGNHREVGDTGTRVPVTSTLTLDIVRGIYTCRDGNHREIFEARATAPCLGTPDNCCLFSESNCEAQGKGKGKVGQGFVT